MVKLKVSDTILVVCVFLVCKAHCLPLSADAEHFNNVQTQRDDSTDTPNVHKNNGLLEVLQKSNQNIETTGTTSDVEKDDLEKSNSFGIGFYGGCCGGGYGGWGGGYGGGWGGYGGGWGGYSGGWGGYGGWGGWG